MRKKLKAISLFETNHSNLIIIKRKRTIVGYCVLYRNTGMRASKRVFRAYCERAPTCTYTRCFENIFHRKVYQGHAYNPFPKHTNNNEKFTQHYSFPTVRIGIRTLSGHERDHAPLTNRKIDLFRNTLYFQHVYMASKSRSLAFLCVAQRTPCAHQ